MNGVKDTMITDVKKAIETIAGFINRHKDYWESNKIVVDYNLNEKTNVEDLNQSIQKILCAYKNDVVDWEWSDYSEATKTLCGISSLVSLEQLEQWELKDVFFQTIDIGIKIAGDEIGYDYKGIRTIKEYAPLLPEEYLIEILTRNESLEGGYFHSDYRFTVLRALIENCLLKSEVLTSDEHSEGNLSKEILKFRFYDSYIIIGIILKRIRSFIASKYPSYRYITIKELNNQIGDEISDTNFLFALIDDNDCIYVKLDRGVFDLYLSITRDPDPNNMDYIFDSHISLVDDDIHIKFDSMKGDRYANVNIQNHQPKDVPLPFSFNNWDQLQFEKISDFTDSLVKRLGILEKSRERFDLICYVAKNLNKLSERIVCFRKDVDVELNENEIILRDNICEQSAPDNFFGDTVNNICAVIGKNGSGKTSVFKSILYNPIFGFSENNSKVEQHFILFKIGENYYYSITSGLTLNNETDFNLKKTDHIPLDIMVCYISNTFDIFAINNITDFSDVNEAEKTESFVDLSTINQIQMLKKVQDSSAKEDIANTDCILRYQNHEKYRIYTLARFLEKYADELKLDVKKLNLEKIETKNGVLPQLSSGQYARWSIFAKLFSLFYHDQELEDNPLRDYPKYDNYIILFDEAELYMHPEWQKKLINDMIMFLEKINFNHQFFSNITLLFSSNSPFLMSDLPEECIQLFDEDVTKQKTFGQHIYMILKDLFFMKEGTIGEFATKCINKALEVNENSTDEDKKYLEYIANIVGDKLTSYYLNEKLGRCFNREGSDK